jgi:hypothetical protein
MSVLHVLDQTNGIYRCVVHRPTPAGNNSAGVSWRDVIKAAGLNATTLAEGTLPGQITTAEKDQVIAGDVFEVALSIALRAGGSENAQIDAAALAAHQQAVAALAEKYAWFGKVR